MCESMFCYQCEQTAGGTGCTRAGVCGKNAEVAALQDLLVYQLKGISACAQQFINQNQAIDKDLAAFVHDGIFSTLTNVNFDADYFVEQINQAQYLKQQLLNRLGMSAALPECALYQAPDTKQGQLAEAPKAGVMADASLNNDLRSLRELITYGLKGMGAYAHHARVLNQTDPAVDAFFFKALSALTDNKLGVNDLFSLAMELGQVNLRCMELLDQANTSSYGHPEPTQVCITRKPGPFIVVSGHDLKDLKTLLEQTMNTGVNIYTHGEMLPCHAYPELKKYPHLAGNYGGAWQDQQKEFDHLPGCIVMTTNCLQRPRPSYQDRIFTTGLVGWPDIPHIEEVDGQKDFTPVIAKAIELGGWTDAELPAKHITVGFGHHATLSHAAEIIDAVKQGAIKHFFLIGGCDGAKTGRNYYTEFAESAPKDTVILTLACGKYRFNKLDFGTIGGLPRLLDVGQCNDAYSAVKIALALADAFKCGVNDLPLTLILSWYEQKAVCILLTLLSLNIQNIYLGPSLPAFLSPNILTTLVNQFHLHPTSTASQDLATILG